MLSALTWNGAHASAAQHAARQLAKSKISTLDEYVRVQPNEVPHMSFKGYCALANLEVRHALHSTQPGLHYTARGGLA